jgi:hypothetical protein
LLEVLNGTPTISKNSPPISPLPLKVDTSLQISPTR